jgi:hypothetical protein
MGSLCLLLTILYKVKIVFAPHLAACESQAPLKISVCFKTLTVTVGQGLINLLVEPGSLRDAKDTHFDIWLHTILIHAMNDYNRV